MVFIFRDVTERREMEEQRELLLGSISHELKNYITSIEGYAHIVRKKLKDKGDENLISFSEKLYHKVEVMRTVIISMLDLSKLRVGKLDMQIEEIDLKNVLDSVVADLQSETSHRLLIKNEISMKVKADNTKIGQVLTNLLTNAIKYSPDPTDIHIIFQKRDGEGIIGIRDFGKGIQKEKIEKIFKPFYRAVSEDEKHSISGSGLGLYISSEIINQHGGRLWVESEPGKGSTFYFALPLLAQKEAYLKDETASSLLDRIKMLLQFKAQSV
jgi:signal transduction histidine kinase